MWIEIAQSDDLMIDKEEDLFKYLRAFVNQFEKKQREEYLEAYVIS